MVAKRLVGRLSLVSFLILSLVLISPLTAVAQTMPQHRSIIAPMTVNCTNLSDSAREFVKSHGLCGYGKNGNVQPNGQPVEGDCGTSELDLSQGNPNVANVKQRLVSTLGPIVYVNDSAYLNNITQGGDVVVSWNRPAFGSVFEDTQYAATGPGDIFGQLTGSVTLVSSVQCNIGPAYDSIRISG